MPETLAKPEQWGRWTVVSKDAKSVTLMCSCVCRFCNGSRHVNARNQCSGCGMPAANANVPESVRRQQKLRLKCPKCRGTHIVEIEKDRFNCETCDAVFEAADMGYVDDRPEQNAMKKERAR